MTAWIRRRLEARADGGFTLVEMLVALVLMSLVGGIFLTAVISASKTSNDTKQEQDLNEEARLAINRMARELREASSIVSVQNPDGPSYSASAITSATFTADFNGDGCIDGVMPSPAPTPTPTCQPYAATNPETLTYCWDPSATVRQLYIIPGVLSGGSCQVSGALPILAGQVTGFKLSYFSNDYLYDADGDGHTSWLELDNANAPVGDGNDVLDDNELKRTDSVLIDLSVASNGAHPQNYTTQVDLRNLS